MSAQDAHGQTKPQPQQELRPAGAACAPLVEAAFRAPPQHPPEAAAGRGAEAVNFAGVYPASWMAVASSLSVAALCTDRSFCPMLTSRRACSSTLATARTIALAQLPQVMSGMWNVIMGGAFLD